MVTVEGDHNSERCQQAVNQAVGFFRRNFSSGTGNSLGGSAGESACSNAGSISVAVAATTPVQAQSLHQQPHHPQPHQPQLQVWPSMGPAAAAQTGSQMKAASWAPPAVHSLPKPLASQAAPLGVKAKAPGTSVTLEFSPNWQATLESKLRQMGLATPEARRQLRAMDRMGIPVSLCAAPGGAGCLAPGRFPLVIEWGGAAGGWPEQQPGLQSPMPSPGWYSRMASGGG